jgi:hypothetical protein
VFFIDAASKSAETSAYALGAILEQFPEEGRALFWLRDISGNSLGGCWPMCVTRVTFTAVSISQNQPGKRLNQCACANVGFFSGVTNEKSRAFLRRKLLLTIDARSDGMKK